MVMKQTIRSGTILAAIIFLPLSATNAQTNNIACGNGENASVCFSSIDERKKVQPAVRTQLTAAATASIDIAHSEAFETEVKKFYENHAQSGAHSRRWEGFEPEQAVKDIQTQLNGLNVITYGGIRGWFLLKIWNNLAFDGGDDPSAPIRLNRAAFPRTVAEIGNTYIHEAAHRAGWSHQRDQNLDQRCEPPYVLGQIAEKLIDPVAWQKVKAASKCRLLE